MISPWDAVDPPPRLVQLRKERPIARAGIFAFASPAGVDTVLACRPLRTPLLTALSTARTQPGGDLRLNQLLLRVLHDRGLRIPSFHASRG
jgi:hypothetical protein